ncbi:DUF4386 domain-containing protein [bacterium AH-315-J19]|nr:DUF4386 domain-containing protein [Robiginitomaculum sp.]MBN4058522.1 DUF4386 domain-containing protein [bacterium AH-315-J19]
MSESLDMQGVARCVGWALLATIGFGILGAIFIAQGIDINMSADIAATAENMLEAETRLRAKAYMGVLLFGLSALISVGFYLLLRKSGQFLAGWSLFVSLGSAVLFLLGAVFAMNAAQIAGDEAYTTLTDASGRLMLTSLQATSDYTSFHLGLVLSSAANAGFFYLFLKSGLIPKIISGWGLFASLFVAVMIVARDFIPALGHNGLTAAFMAANLIALVSTGLYLGIKGVRQA